MPPKLDKKSNLGGTFSMCYITGRLFLALSLKNKLNNSIELRIVPINNKES